MIETTNCTRGDGIKSAQTRQDNAVLKRPLQCSLRTCSPAYRNAWRGKPKKMRTMGIA